MYIEQLQAKKQDSHSLLLPGRRQLRVSQLLWQWESFNRFTKVPWFAPTEVKMYARVRKYFASQTIFVLLLYLSKPPPYATLCFLRTNMKQRLPKPTQADLSLTHRTLLKRELRGEVHASRQPERVCI